MPHCNKREGFLFSRFSSNLYGIYGVYISFGVSDMRYRLKIRRDPSYFIYPGAAIACRK